MSLYVGMDYTPIEDYDTTVEQKWDALSHVRSRVPASDVLEMAAMLGIVDYLPTSTYETPMCRWKHPLNARNLGRRSNGKTYCLECGRQRRLTAQKAKAA